MFETTRSPEIAREPRQDDPADYDWFPEIGARQPRVPRRLVACMEPAAVGEGRDQLETLGFEVCLATGWEQALADAQAAEPFVMVVDSAFLGGVGAKLCAALRRRLGSAIPILVMCRNHTEVRRALAAGASDVAAKPIDWDVVSRRLMLLDTGRRAALEARNDRQQLALARRRATQALNRLEAASQRDPLTQLPSRRHFGRILERSLASVQGWQRSVGLLYIDIDRFRELNETLGRDNGDTVLKTVAERLNTGLRSGFALPKPGSGPMLKVAARLSGDQFALMLTYDPSDEEGLSRLARDVLTAVSRPILITETEVFLTASIGIASSRAERVGGEELLQCAETAMHEAQRQGGDRCRAYSAAMAGITARKLHLDRRLRGALKRGELLLYYQPVVHSDDGQVGSVEALLRWEHPVLGMVSPSEFVPVAEDTGLMNEIGAWVLEEACRQLQAWLDSGIPPIRVAVNVSRCQLSRGDLPEIVHRTLQKTGLRPELLELELSERGALRNEPGIVEQLTVLKAMGVRLVVDDFGTGQSAIAYLRQFPLDGLKIDRSFVGGMLDDENDAIITSAIVAMAHQLSLGVVAEGVELETQLQKLRQLGCEEIQGFVFSEPLTASELRVAVTIRDGRLWFMRGRPGLAG